MSSQTRTVLYLASAALAFAIFMHAAAHLQPFGTFARPYEQYIIRETTPQRHVYNAPTAVNFDYRGFDTLGEENIFFASITGLLFMLLGGRAKEPEDIEITERAATPEKSAALRAFAPALAAFTAAMALNLGAHGSLTPGGGFQGGTVFGSAVACIFCGLGMHGFLRVAHKDGFDAFEALGAMAYAAIGLATAFAGGYFLRNILPFGQTGALVSGGTIYLINAAVFIEIACGFVALAIVFLGQLAQEKAKAQ